MSQLIIFTDIDGTLIDLTTYSFAEAAPAITAVLARHIPLILCSSKTRAEQVHLRRALGIDDPFIVENGSAIFIPPGLLPFEFAYRLMGGWPVIELGVTAVTIQAALTAVRHETGLLFQGFAAITGLDEAAALRAQQREYSETIVTPLAAPELAQLATALAAKGLAIVSGGKFHTVTGAGSDKGTAVTHLTALYRQKFGHVTTIGLGDSANDRPLLTAVDRPYLVQKPGGLWQEMDVPGLERAVPHRQRPWGHVEALAGASPAKASTNTVNDYPRFLSPHQGQVDNHWPNLIDIRIGHNWRVVVEDNHRLIANHRAIGRVWAHGNGETDIPLATAVFIIRRQETGQRIRRQVAGGRV